MNMSAKFSLLYLPLLCSAILVKGIELKVPDAPFTEKPTEILNKASAEFKNDGIHKGNKSLVWTSGLPKASLVMSRNNITLFELECRVSPSFPGWFPFTKFKDKIIPETKSILRELDFKLTPDIPGKFTEKISLNKRGNAEIELTFDCQTHQAKLKEKIVYLFMPLHSISGKTLKINNRKITLPSKEKWSMTDGKENSWTHSGWFPKVGKITVSPDKNDESYTIDLKEAADLVIFRSKKGAHLSIRPRDKNTKTVRLELDPGTGFQPSAKDNVVNGINFTKNNDFTVSLFDEKRNFFLNPSFESGTRYFETRGVDLKKLISTDARSGRHSLRLQNGINTFSFPIFSGQDYTFSFYAKSADGKENSFSAGLRSYENTKATQTRKYFKISGNEWKRFEIPFRIPRRAVRFFFSGKNILIDDLQLEPGKKATPYAGNKIGIELVTDSPECEVVNANRKFNARLLVRGPAGTKGKMLVTITDFFKRRHLEQEFPFEISTAGETSVPLGDENVFPLGVNVIRADVKPEGLPPYTDFLRLTRMKYADNTARNKNIHGTAYYGYNYIRFTPPAHELNLLKICGIGAHSYLSNHKDPETYAILKKYGMDTFGSYIERGSYDFQKHRWLAPVNDAIQKVTGGATARELETFSPEVLKAVEEAAFRIAGEHPHVKYWTAHTEPSGYYTSIRNHKMKEYAKYILALNRGIMRATPDAVFNPMGACGMGKQGRDEVLSLLRCCNELEPETRFKVIDIHTYRDFPELPDTEMDLTAFMDGLEKVGYKDIPIHLGEGAYWTPVIVNEWLGIAPWQATVTKDRYGMHVPTYDLGWGEQVSAAMVLRHWLVAYKYMDRVKFTCPWLTLLIDNYQPFAWLCMSSNLTDLLGNSTFRQDIRFAPGARAYLFEDRAGRPVAAIWHFEEMLDRGLKNSGEMSLDSKGLDLEFIDIMGNLCSVRNNAGTVTLPLSNYPVFIRARKGETDKLAKAISAARVMNMDKLPVELLATGVKGMDRIQFDAVNLLSRTVELELAIGSGPMEKIVFPPNSRKQMSVSPGAPLSFNKVNDIAIPVKVRYEGREMTSEFNLSILPLRKVRKGFQWKDIPSIPLKYVHPEFFAKMNGLKWNGPNDLSGSYKAAWSREGLYFRFDVTDDDFVMDHSTKRGVEGWYDNDTIQLFIDSLGDGRENGRRGNANFDWNDYSYELLPTSENSAVVYRRHAPDQQQTGGLNGLKNNVLEPAAICKFERKGNKLIYDVFIPARCLQPMELSAGSMPGLGIKVFDRDGKDKCAKQVLSNVDGDVFKRTDIYTQLLFAE